MRKLRRLSREAHLKEPVGERSIAIREFIQWWYIVRWDMAVTKTETLEQVLTLLSLYPKEHAEIGELKKGWLSGSNG